MKAETAIKIMLSLIMGIMLFHLSIVFKIIPYEITWGGRLTNDSEMHVFEGISIAINLFLGFILLVRGKYIRQMVSVKFANVVLWIFFGLFFLNTIGNIFAKTNFEKSFALLTLASSILIWIILKGKKVE